MAEWELIQDRVLSGKGVLQVPTDVRKGRAYLLFTDVIRDPSNRYLNFTWNPPRGRYGNLVFLRDKYVISTTTIDFERQCYDGISDISGQNLLALKCAYAGILQTFFNLGNALALPSISIENSIADYESLALSWDEVRVIAYADTALQLRLYRISYDVCDEQNINTLNAPIPDAPIEKVPPGTPVPNSDPYDDDTSDNGNSAPYPGDEPAPPEEISGTWLLTWDDRNGSVQSGTWAGVSTDTWAVVAGANTNCSLSGNGGLVKNGTITVEPEFNCNPFGFVSTILSQTFTPDP